MAFSSNVKQVTNQLRKTESATRSATRRALNKVGQQGLTLTLRTLSGATGLTQKKLRQYISQDRADYTDLSTSIRVVAHTFNVASFGGRQTKKGVSSAAWGVRRVYPGTFMIHGRTAMKRVGKARYPIKPIWGPRITREFVRENTETLLEQLVARQLKPTLAHEMDFALGRIGMSTSP